eukprot:CAMPEP_0197462824 /NCGR_PEP_ID=MMETSP1175-20131217/60101_1 /TAXON_ID=1003142 /ORGANISM="Triceratium dubium, Strain CCMP147" /LENGTH=258 /DNA_ID=CAMNT_0042998427 /DNA_START=17 /DNA_END=796 /DNA_ORIENTATION=+
MTTSSAYSSKVYMGVASLLLLLNAKQIYDLRYAGDHVDVTQHATEMREAYQMNMPLQDFVDELKRLKESSYIDLHVVPVFVWPVLLFMQMTKAVRKRLPQWVHELLGTAFLITSAVMLLGVALMFFTGESMYGENDFQWDPLGQPAKFFTFTSASIVFGAWWLVCGVQLWRFASPTTRRLHAAWVRRFVATGLGTGTMRILYIGYCQTFHSMREGGTPLEEEENNMLTGYTMWAGFFLNIVVNELFMPLTQEANKKSL